MRLIKYGNDARLKLLSGVQIIAKAVKVTLGPSGRNVFIRNNKEHIPFSTKDGVTVAGQVFSDDPEEMSAIETMQEVANLADASAGDGTTTATILAEAIFEKGLNFDNDLNLLDIKKGIDIATRYVVNELNNLKVSCKDDKDVLRKVAMVSSNNDEEVSDVVLKAYGIAGNQGVVNIKRSRTHETYMTSVEGMNLPMGFKSVYYQNKPEDDLCEFEKPYVFITNEKINELSDNMHFLLQAVTEENASIVIICKEMDQAVSDLFIKNKIENNFRVCVCIAPLFGEEQNDLLKDLSTFLGKKAFFENEGIDFNSISKDTLLNEIPRCEAVQIGKNHSAFKAPFVSHEYYMKQVDSNEFELDIIDLSKKEIDAKAKEIKSSIDSQVASLRKSLKKHLTEYEKSFIQSRISRLTEGLAFINIGAYSDTEFIEKQHRIQDSLHAVKAASEEGIIPGGGVALYSIANDYAIPMPEIETNNLSIIKGIEIVMESIQVPFQQIILNVGTELSEKDLKHISENFNAGYDAREKIIVDDMIKAGVIDPVKVTRVALETASSIAGMMLTTECTIIDPSVFKTANYQNQV